MPTIRRPGSPPSDPQVSPAPLPEGSAPAEHSLSHLSVPQETTPTWELEMLVSGAVLFGLFQLPPLVSGAYVSITPRLGAKASVVAFEAYMFGSAIMYALIAGFVLHLASRAYWVALVGLDSVFPQGIRWERADFGPYTREVLRSRFTSLPARIERIDNFASVLFASAFGVAFLILAMVVLLGLLAALTWGISHLLLHDQAFARVFFVLVAVLVFGPIVALVVDRRIGSRLAPQSVGARLLRAAALFQYRSQWMGIYGPIRETLFTNLRKRIVRPALIVIVFAAMAAGVLSLLAARRHLSIDGYGMLPRSGAGALDYRHYADERTGDDRYSTVPTIQSDLLHDPYVRLFVPYVPLRDDDALARACPAESTPAHAGGSPAPARQQAGTRILACLTRLRAVSLDGHAVDPGFRFYTDPQSSLRGVLGYIPVDGLPRGRHVLVIQPMPLPADAPREDSLATHPDSIPFRL